MTSNNSVSTNPSSPFNFKWMGDYSPAASTQCSIANQSPELLDDILFWNIPDILEKLRKTPSLLSYDFKLKFYTGLIKPYFSFDCSLLVDLKFSFLMAFVCQCVIEHKIDDAQATLNLISRYKDFEECLKILERFVYILEVSRKGANVTALSQCISFYLGMNTLSLFEQMSLNQLDNWLSLSEFPETLKVFHDPFNSVELLLEFLNDSDFVKRSLKFIQSSQLQLILVLNLLQYVGVNDTNKFLDTLEKYPQLIRLLPICSFSMPEQIKEFYCLLQDIPKECSYINALEQLLTLYPTCTIAWTNLLKSNRSLPFLIELLFFVKAYPAHVLPFIKICDGLASNNNHSTHFAILQEWISKDVISPKLTVLIDLLADVKRDEVPNFLENFQKALQQYSVLAFQLLEYLKIHPSHLNVLCVVGSLSLKPSHFSFYRLDAILGLLEKKSFNGDAVSIFLSSLFSSSIAEMLLWEGISNHLTLVNNIFNYNSPVHSAVILWHLYEQIGQALNIKPDASWHDLFSSIYTPQICLKILFDFLPLLPARLINFINIQVEKKSFSLAERLYLAWINFPALRNKIEDYTELFFQHDVDEFINLLLLDRHKNYIFGEIALTHRNNCLPLFLKAFAKITLQYESNLLLSDLINCCIHWYNVLGRLPEEVQWLVIFAASKTSEDILKVFIEEFKSSFSPKSKNHKYAMVVLRCTQNLKGAFTVLKCLPSLLPDFPYNVCFKKREKEALAICREIISARTKENMIRRVIQKTKIFLLEDKNSYYPGITSVDSIISNFLYVLVGGCVTKEGEIDLEQLKFWFKQIELLCEEGFPADVHHQILNFLSNPSIAASLEAISFDSLHLNRKFKLLLRALLKLKYDEEITKCHVIRGILHFLFSYIKQSPNQGSCTATSIILHCLHAHPEKLIDLILTLSTGKWNIFYDSTLHQFPINLSVELSFLSKSFNFNLKTFCFTKLQNDETLVSSLPCIERLGKYFGLDKESIHKWTCQALKHWALTQKISSIDSYEIIYAELLLFLLKNVGKFSHYATTLSSQRLESEGSLVFLSEVEPIMCRVLENAIMQSNGVNYKFESQYATTSTLIKRFDEILNTYKTQDNFKELNRFCSILKKNILDEISKLSFIYDPNAGQGKCFFIRGTPASSNFLCIDTFEKYKILLMQPVKDFKKDADLALLSDNNAEIEFIVAEMLQVFEKVSFQKEVSDLFIDHSKSLIGSPWDIPVGSKPNIVRHCFQGRDLGKGYSTLSYPVPCPKSLLGLIDYYVQHFDLSLPHNCKRMGNMYAHSMNFIFDAPCYTELKSLGLVAFSDKCRLNSFRMANQFKLDKEKFESWMKVLLNLPFFVNKQITPPALFEKVDYISVGEIFSTLKTFIMKVTFTSEQRTCALQLLEKLAIGFLIESAGANNMHFIPVIDTNWVDVTCETRINFSLWPSPFSQKWEFWKISSCMKHFENFTVSQYFGSGCTMEIVLSE